MTTRRIFQNYRTLLKESRNSKNIDAIKRFASEWSKAQSYNLIPTVKPFPILGNKWRGIPVVGTIDSTALHKSMEHINREYGDIVKFPELVDDHDVVFLFDVNDIEKVLKSEVERPFMKSIHHYKYELRKDYFKSFPGILDVNTEDWKRCFSNIYETVSSNITAEEFISQIEQICNNFINRINTLKNSDDEVSTTFIKDLEQFSIELFIGVVLDSNFSSSLSNRNNSVIKEIMNSFEDIEKITVSSDIFTPIRTKFNTPTWKKYVEGLDHIRKIIQNYSENYAKSQNANDIKNISLLRKLLESNKDNPRNAEIAAFDFALIGKNTVSNTLASIIYQLAQHQDVQDILHRQISSVLKTDKVKLNAEILHKMNYLTACIEETMRMFPIIVANSRITSQDITLSGYQIPKGTQLILCQYLIGNSPKHFDNHSKFQPERWLMNKPNKLHEFAVIPYGNGKRMCPMKHITDKQIKIAICKLIQYYKIEFRHELLEYATTPLLVLNGPLQFAFIDRD